MSGSCRIADIVHSAHAHSITGPSSGWLILSGTFFFCRNRHPLMRDDAFLLHVLCPPLSPAQACIGEVPSSASYIGRPSSTLHIRLLRLKSSRRKRNDIDADGILPFSPKMPYRRNLSVLRHVSVSSSKARQHIVSRPCAFGIMATCRNGGDLHPRADEEDIRATWRKLQPECDALSEDGVAAKLFPSRPEPSPFSRIYVCFAKNLSIWAETAPARIILRFSSKTSYKRNLGVFTACYCFSLFPFPGCRSSSSFFSFLLFFLPSPFLRMPSFMRGAFSFFFRHRRKERRLMCSFLFALLS